MNRQHVTGLIVIAAVAVVGTLSWFWSVKPHLACTAAKGQPVVTLTGVACAAPFKGKW